ncbi:MAG: phytanoyl-CoA dioxygenase family protein [Pseudomonadota bacterium]
MSGTMSNTTSTVWMGADAGDFDAFTQCVEQKTKPEHYPLAASIENNIPIYDGDAARKAAAGEQSRKDLMAEWATSLGTGPGVIVIRKTYDDAAPLDRATELFDEIIQKQRDTSEGGGDHFAKPGANDRIWNALEKHCLADPENFVDYYDNIVLAMVCEAWLGPGYQMTAQVNRVNPGGGAQAPHRDYHLGFLQPDQIARYPSHIHAISPVLTLQGAVAHCDMPIESGPTMLLPFSQSYFEGYLAFGRPEFQDYFAQHYVQLPLKEGDSLFFNPALMHGAGENYSKDIFRMANLLQISSAFGVAMETMDRTKMSGLIYPILLRRKKDETMSFAEILAAIGACSYGYSFPTNLDTDPPIGGLAPQTQAAMMIDAISREASPEEVLGLLAKQAKRRL